MFFGMHRIGLPLYACFLWLCWVTPSHSVQYSVDGLNLGDAVAGSALQTYGCKPSDEFAQLTLCERTQTRNRGYDYSAFGAVMHDANGVAVFLKVKVAPVQMTKSEAEKENNPLTNGLGGKPLSDRLWGTARDRPRSLIARW